MKRVSHLWKLEWGGSLVRPWRGRRLLTVRLADHDGNVHSWAPRWDDLFSVFVTLCVLEKEEPSVQWLERVADTATTILEICAERLAPLLGAETGARLLLTGSQERFRKELKAAWEEQLALNEIFARWGEKRVMQQFKNIIDEVGDELLLKPEGWLMKELGRRLEATSEE